MPSLGRLSISTRLALWYGLSVTMLLGFVVAFLYTGFHLTLHRDFDADLNREAQRVASVIEGAPDAEAAFRQAAENSPYAVRLLTPGGRVAAANPRLPDLDVHALDAETDASHTHASDSVRTRYAQLPGGGWVAVVGVESGLHRETHRLGWLLALGVALGVGVAALSGYGLARRALRPVAALTDAAGQIGPGARLPTPPGPPDELGRLAEAFNGLLARLDEALAREQRFRADAAHELFTPVTAARSEVEVALRRERDPEAYREALGRLGRHVERMAALMTGLLALSRAETEGGEPEAVDLGPLAQTIASRVKLASDAKGVALTMEVETAVVWAARADVEIALENLLDNAVKYTPPGGTVALTIRTDGEEAAARVVDTGAGFDAAERDRLFERFYRADAPAVQRQAGSGLGLAIAQRLAERHGGRIVATSRGHGHGSTFVLVLRRVDALHTVDGAV